MSFGKHLDTPVGSTSPQMEQVLGIVRQVAPTDATVLVTGESGTGKGVLARTFHKLSQRADKPLVLVDCSAITPNLIESELFGHEREHLQEPIAKPLGALLKPTAAQCFSMKSVSYLWRSNRSF